MAIALISVCAVLGCAVLLLVAEWVYRWRRERAAYARLGIAVGAPSDEDRAMLESEAWGGGECTHA